MRGKSSSLFCVCGTSRHRCNGAAGASLLAVVDVVVINVSDKLSVARGRDPEGEISRAGPCLPGGEASTGGQGLPAVCIRVGFGFCCPLVCLNERFCEIALD